jgi:hypothetical protein
VTGGFGEPSCQQCHFDNPLNAPGGAFSLLGVPAQYEPSQKYQITIRLSREDTIRGGFEIAARFGAGSEKGKQAGAWRVLDNRAQVIRADDDPALLFVQHTVEGTLGTARGANTWSVEWTAPAAADAPVEFNAAANAANDDASPLGDYIYVTAAHSSP